MRFHTWITLTTLAVLLQISLSGCLMFDSAGNVRATVNSDGAPPSGFENFLAGALNILGDGLITLGAMAGGLGAAGVAAVQYRRSKRTKQENLQQDAALVHVTSLVDKMRSANNPDAQKKVLLEAGEAQLRLGISSIVQGVRPRKA